MTTLQEHIDAGYIKRTKHPTLPLSIYCYTQLCQYDRMWNDITLSHRGLIRNDSTEAVVSRPFKKFFNYEELESLPNGPYNIYEKYDGSFIISYFVNGVPYLASKASFTSDQAVWANKVLCEKYNDVVMDPSLTYIFELIHPQNRIVVDYGDTYDLILLAVIDTETGEELDPMFRGFNIAQGYDSNTPIETLKAQDVPNREGYILQYEDGTRVKIKFETYLQLHRVLTNTSSYDVWEYLRDGKDLAPLLEKICDEFYQWVHSLVDDLNRRYRWLEAYANYKACMAELRYDNRKGRAEFIKTQEHPSLIFAALDGKDLGPIIWNLIKPEYSKPFSNI